MVFIIASTSLQKALDNWKKIQRFIFEYQIFSMRVIADLGLRLQHEEGDKRKIVQKFLPSIPKNESLVN